MERVHKIPDTISTIQELAAATELALDEVASIAKRAQLPSGTTLDPESGDMSYDDTSKTLYIFNSKTGSFDTIQAT